MEDSKSDNQMKRKEDNKKIAFKQFDFKTYNNYKEYPLYHILSKKKLVDDGEIDPEDIKENAEVHDDENSLRHESEGLIEGEHKEESEKIEKEAHSEYEDHDIHSNEAGNEQQADEEDEENEEEHELIENDEEINDEEDEEMVGEGDRVEEEHNQVEEDLGVQNEYDQEMNEDHHISDYKEEYKSNADENEEDDKHGESIESEEGEGDNKSEDMSEPKEEIRYGKKRFDQVLEDYEALSFEDRRQLSWDEVWGIYLREVSQKVNAKFYKTMLKFMILFREWCNEYGWQKIVETQKLLADEKIKVDLPSNSIPSTHKNALQQQQMIIIAEIAKRSRDGRDEFTKINSAEHMPEVWNEFVTIFLEQRDEYIDRGDAIDLTLNFWSWLYKKGHTWIKLAMKNYS